MNKSLANGIVKVEKLSVIAFKANVSFNQYDNSLWTQSSLDKVQLQFEKSYHSLVAKFRDKKEDAKNYTQWETISPVEFMEEVNN